MRVPHPSFVCSGGAFRLMAAQHDINSLRRRVVPSLKGLEIIGETRPSAEALGCELHDAALPGTWRVGQQQRFLVAALAAP